MHYIIRPFETVDEHAQCEDLQREVWAGDTAVPSHMTLTVQRHGGLTMGAFDDDGLLLGFVMSMLAPAHQAGAARALCHHSHIAAVRTELHGRGIGEALKRAQANDVRARGLNLITWTYDLLEARNARLNIGKLGAICRTYIRNCYGDMPDVLNRGLPSDRFEVEWWLDERAEAQDMRVMAAGSMKIPVRRGRRDASLIEIDIPTDFQQLKRSDPNSAREVRMHTRDEFERAFQSGYAVTEFTAHTDRAYYTLTKLG
jgi:predicted GNAT superfamily acetyltransferase